MLYFNYDITKVDSEYYEALEFMMDNWESEIVEFKEAKGHYDTNKVGQYFSAISNEANLANRQYGWFILGVSEKDKRHIVGTAFKKGDKQLLEKYKYEISKGTTDNITFWDIIELYPMINGEAKRVLMFKIPAAVTGIATEWHNHCYARSGESIVSLPQYKLDEIRNQERRDWSKQIAEGATFFDLDKDAIAEAKNNYKEKMNRPHISEEIDSMSDEAFLEKLKLIKNGHVTNAAMLLLGREDKDNFLASAPKIMWRLFNANEEFKDYQLFSIPFIFVADKVFAKVRNLVYRYMVDRNSLFPIEKEQYDNWLLRELFNNCIAHSNYQLGGRIYIDEHEDYIEFANPGSFIPENIENVLKPSYRPPFHRNQLLAESMVNFNMIDTATSGVKKVFRILKDRYFPLPDYNLDNKREVSVVVYGKILDPKYTYYLYEHPELSIDLAFLLDMVQKNKKIPTEARKYLRDQGLIEGRGNNIFLAADVSRCVQEEAQYIKNKGFTDKKYKEFILEYLRKYHKANRKKIDELLLDVLPRRLSDEQKHTKINTLLTSLRRKGLIKRDSSNQQSGNWILANEEQVE